MDNKIEIRYKGSIHTFYPNNSFSEREINNRLYWIASSFNDSKENIDDTEWIWCLVGNIIEEHAWGENKEIRKGTKQFRGGAKVYCFPPFWGDGFESIKVIGKPRKSRVLITVIMRSNLITNWRLQQVYEPFIIAQMMTNFGWTNSDESKSRIESMVEYLANLPPQVIDFESHTE